MSKIDQFSLAAMVFAAGLLGSGLAAAAVHVEGQVQAGGAGLANSTVALWAAGAGEPKELAQTKSGREGQFSLSVETAGVDSSLYLVAKGGETTASKGSGDNPAIALLAVLGSQPPATVTINEMTTIASVITHNQYIDGTAIKGSPLALRIAAGNVPNFVDLATGDYGPVMGDGLNSAQTPTMANFGTLANVLAGCTTKVKADACAACSQRPRGPPAPPQPTRSPPPSWSSGIPRISPRESSRCWIGSIPYSKNPSVVVRPTPYLPYLTFAPSAWVFPLKFTGGGLSGPGKLMIDSQGNAWAADNFIVGMQNIDKLWAGGISKVAPNGKTLSPALRGFTGGGVGGPGIRAHPRCRR